MKLLFLLLVITSFLSSFETFASSSKQIKLNDNEWPPYFFGGASGKPRGIGKEVLQRCLPETGYTFRFTFFPIKRMRKYMEEGELDINIYSYKKSRESFLVYGKEPIFKAGYRPVVLAESNIKIDSIEDFDPLLLGHLLGLRYSPKFYDYVQDRIKQGNIVTTPKSQYILNLLLEKRIDVYVGISESTKWYANYARAGHLIKILDYDVKTSQYFISLSKKSKRIKDKQGFLDTMDNCIKELKVTGEYEDITSKYLNY